MVSGQYRTYLTYRTYTTDHRLTMRILQISSASSFGGGERHVVDLSDALQSRGHEVYVALRPESPLPKHLHVPARNIKTLPLRNALDAQSAQGLARIVKQNEIEVVHAHMARDYSLAAYAAHSYPKPKFFVTRHVLFPLNRLHRRTLSKTTKVIAVSEAVAKQLSEQQLVPEEKIAIVPNGIDVDRFANACTKFDRAAFLRSRDLPFDCLLVASIGELRKLKRHDDLIRATQLVHREVPKLQVVIAGVDTSPNGENRRALIDLLNQLKLSNQVQLVGWLDDADQLFCAADVFVSASETESFGLSIAEAMAAGTAVVATRTEGAQEVVKDRSTGLLVPIGDVERLAMSIIQLLKNTEERTRLAKQAAAEARSRFSLTRMVDEMEKLYSG